VVTGYTTQVKKDIAASVAVVDVTDAKKVPTGGSTDALLQGQAAGVTVVTRGAPGAGAEVLIRGISNFGNSQPLYVIDGVQSSSMSNINPNDIESIQVLKDAGATAIYGISGGNGVVIITTKHGKAGQSTLSYDAYYGSQVPKGGNVFNILSSSGMSKLAYLVGDVTAQQKIYPGGAGTIPTYGYQGPGGVAGVAGGPGADPVGDLLSKYNFDANNPGNDFLIQKFNQTGTDWFHELFQSAPEQYHTVSASGANDKNNYYMSVGYLDQQGTEIYTYYKRYEARANTAFNIAHNIRVGETGYMYYTEAPVGGFNNQNEGDPISMTYREMPQIPVYDISGIHYGGDYDGPGGEPLGNASNPVAQEAQLLNDHFKTWNITGNIYGEIDFAKHFTAHMSIGGNIQNWYQYGFGSNQYQDYEAHGGSNSVYEGAQFFSQYNWTNTIKYSQIFGKHNITALVGYEQRDQYGRQVGGNANNLFSLDPSYVNLTNGTSNFTNYSYAIQPIFTESFFGSLDYIYADKYIVRGTIRRDGSSQFYTGHQYGTFPSVSLAWRISQEDFLKSVNWINDLKLRASWGEAGNNANVNAGNEYAGYSSSLGNGYYAINGDGVIHQGFYASQNGNVYTTWEVDKTLNFGLDASLFNHVDLTLDVYKKTISGLLAGASLPYTVGGATPPTINKGDIQNKGFDLGLTYRGAAGKDFRYNVGLTFTKYTNIISSYPGNYFDDDGSRVNPIVREQVGHPVGEFFGYKVIGFYSAADIANANVPKYAGAVEGSFKYADVNGDGQITDADRTFIGNPNPDFTYGLNLNATYKQWDFSAVLYGSYGNQDYNYTLYWTDFYGSFNGAKSNDALYKSYGAPGVTNPILPIQSDLNSMGTTQTSSFYVSSGSFLKLRVAQLGYTFEPKIIKMIGMSKLHIYVQGTNLFTITKYKGLDPELPPGGGSNNSFGIDWGNYPANQKQYIVGVNLTF
ncbi:MAG TPA: SusC/RagA family TonB-linked outer membrane protein, partial [Mucilaginibacter sp.]|nr:SusC/RagA family TonB-linked outer membrane protein [Mucilaginibacter sp.]